MNKKIKRHIFLTTLIAAATCTLSLFWLLIGAITYIAALCGWSNFSFINSITSHVLISGLLLAVSGFYLRYVYENYSTPHEEFSCLKHS